MGYRSNIEIISQILDVARNGFCSTKTQIMYKAYLSYTQTKEYLKILTEDGLITYDSTIGRYNATEKGLRFLGLYHSVGEVITMNEETSPQEHVKEKKEARQQQQRLLPQQQQLQQMFDR